MALNDKINGLNSTGIPMVTPGSEEWTLASTFHSLRKASYSNDNERASRVDQQLSMIQNSTPLDQKTLKSNDKVILKNFSSPHQILGQKQVDAMMAFMRGEAKTFYAFDIETLGDVKTGEGLHITEIAMQGFQKSKDGLFKADANRMFSVLIRPDQQSQIYLENLIRRVRSDRFAFNTMSDSERITLVNLMRYSTETSLGSKAANLNPSQLTHNTVIRTLEDRNGRYSYDKLVMNFENYIGHIQSGYNNLKNLDERTHSVSYSMQRYRQQIAAHQNAFFFSYNGDNFDLEVLDRFGKQTGQTVIRPQNHIDYYRLIQTAYANPHSFHEEFASKNDLKNRYFQQGRLTMHEIRKTLGIAGGEAHAAIADVDDRGLGGVVSMTIDKVYNRIHTAKNKGAMDTMSIRPASFTWNRKDVLKVGDQLFSASGYTAFGDSLDFQARMENGELVPHDVSWNKTVLNAKTMYTVNNLREVKDSSGSVTGHVLELLDQDTGRLSFISRSGPNSMDQLAQFVQQQLHSTRGMNREELYNIQKIREEDQARRRYERMTSLSGAGGASRSAGFQAAQRMYGNIEHYQKRLLAKRKNWPTDQLDAELADYRDHATFMSKMDFNSRPVFDANGNMNWVYNPEEASLFFRMAPRMSSEYDHYSAAIKEIERMIPLDPKERNREQIRKVQQQRDMAWRIYNQSMERSDMAGNHTTSRIMESWENRGINLHVGGEQRFFSMQSIPSTERAIRRFISQDDSENPNTQRHRLEQFIDSLHENAVVGAGNTRKFRMINQQSGSIHDTITQIAMDLHSRNMPLEPLETTSLGQRDMSNVTADRNRTAVQKAIQRALSYEGSVFLTGGKVQLHPEVDKFFGDLEGHHLSGLQANNRNAVEMVLRSLEGSNRNLMFDLSVNNSRSNPMAKITVMTPQHSTSVREALMEGRSHPRAVDILIPLINEDGYQVLGKRNLIAHTVAVMDQDSGKIVRRSTAEVIGMQYAHNMNFILSALDEGDFDGASWRSKHVLGEAVKSMSGSRMDIHSYNDAYEARGRMADFDKMSHVNMAPAMIHDLYRKGIIARDDLKDEAFYYDRADRQYKLRTLVGMDDLKHGHFERLMDMPGWAQGANWEGQAPTLYTSGVKEGAVQKGTMSTQDLRDYTLYGHYINMARPNSIQARNFYEFSDDAASRVSRVNAYTNFNGMLDTEKNAQYKSRYMGGNGRTGVNLKVAYITNEELHSRIMDMYNSGGAENLQLLRDEGILVKRNGQEVIDHRRLPTVYEQQAVIAKELMDAMKYTDSQSFDKGTGTFQWHERFAKNGAAGANSGFIVGGEAINGATVNPGDVIGRRYVDGNWEEIRYEKHYTGRLTGVENQVFNVEWDDKPFKISFAGEKGTDAATPSLKLIGALTGDTEISAMISPNPAKRKDFGMMMEGYAKIIINELMKKDQPTRERLIRQLDLASIGLQYNNGQFMDVSGRMPNGIDIKDFNRIAQHRELGINFQTSTGLSTGILEARMMRSPQYYKSVDANGKAVIGYDPEGKKIYASGLDGSSIGHREMKVLRRMGADQTYELAFETMREQATKTGRWQDAQNLSHSIMGFVDPDAPEMAAYKNRILQAHQFESMPELGLDMNTVKGTILDRDTVARHLGIDGKEAGHGFWLQLPEEVAVNVHGGSDRTKVNKIFVPFTHLAREGSNDKIHLQKLQRQIAQINESIKSYSRAKTQNGRGKDSAEYHMQRLQGHVTNYVNQLSKDTLSSKGMTGESVLKAHMPSSASGILKIIGPESAAAIGDEMTFVSVQQAKDMGIYEHVIGKQHIGTSRESEILQDWSRQQNKNVMTIRYPTKHNSAVQFTRVAIDPNLKIGNILTTAFTAERLEGDADGDQLHMIYVDDDNIQKEWAHLKGQRQAEFQGGHDNWSDFLKSRIAEEATGAQRNYNLESLIEGYNKDLNNQDGTRIRQMVPNSEAEIAGKIGKTQIGGISNLNLAIQDFAEEMYGSYSQEYKTLENFGSMLEQKGIDTKQGVALTHDRRSPVGQFRQAFYSGDWKSIRQIDRDYYGSYWSENHNLDDVIDLLSRPQSINGGLDNASYKPGTSSGIDVNKYGLKRTYDTIFGKLSEGDQVNANEYTRLFGRMQQESVAGATPPPQQPRMTGRYQQSSWRSSYTPPLQSRPAPQGAIPDTLHDLSGGWIPNDIFSGINGARNKKIALFGSLALGGVMGYNVLSNTTAPVSAPTPPPPVPPQIPIQSPLPPIPGEPSGANVLISGRGQAVGENLSTLVQEGLSRSGWQGSANMTVNHSDNTNRLTRLWYRDKVEEHM
jgi:hypothetical protein